MSTQTADFTKFPFALVPHPEAATRTGAITHDPVASGFVVATFRCDDVGRFAALARQLAQAARREAPRTGLRDVSAYRQLEPGELGGAVPFDQAICEQVMTQAEKRPETHAKRQQVERIVLHNPHASAILLLEYASGEDALRAARAFQAGQDGPHGDLRPLTALGEHTVGAFENMKQYSTVSRDPNVIQFFNLFPAPGRLDALWEGWQEALPWFFDVAEFRSSFPLRALDPSQKVLLVNYAHCDSTKPFVVGTLYDPYFLESMAACYVRRDVVLPHPFFCKLVPV